jgi:hypothetical protein
VGSQDLVLAMDRLRAAEDVAGVGISGHEPERPSLAGIATATKVKTRSPGRYFMSTFNSAGAAHHPGSRGHSRRLAEFPQFYTSDILTLGSAHWRPLKEPPEARRGRFPTVSGPVICFRLAVSNSGRPNRLPGEPRRFTTIEEER